MRSAALFGLLALLAASSSAPTQEPKKEANAFPPIPVVDLKRTTPVDYSKDVEPVFANKCFVCHSGSVVEGKFDMSTHAGVLKGGKRGAAVVPGKSAESNLFLFCARQKKPIMPPKSEEPLNSQEVSLIKLWVDEGAKAPTMARVKPKIVVDLPPVLVKPVRAVAVSPDGKTVAGSRGNQVNLYDGKKGDFVKALVDPQLKTKDGKEAKAAHISLVESMAFSPDGKTLATGSFQELTLWDVEKGIPTQRVGGFADRVVAISFSADGKFFATGGGAPTEDGEIKIFEAATAKPVGDIKNGHSDTVFGVAFSPDGKLLATCAADKFVKVFEVPGGKLVKSFEGHTHHVMGVGWTPDGKKIASCGADNFVKVWDYEKGEKLRDMQGHQKQVTQLFFVGKTPQFLTVSGDSSVRMWNAENGGNVRQYPGATDFLYAVSASTDGNVVAAGGEDGVVRVYNGQSGALVKAALPPDAEPKKDEKKEEPKKK
ncbi:MAG: domain, G-beta repeat [Gemmataceae bacterium]|nr:domain, G-beta repeat [Gemmataceae bacterium]